MIDLIDFRFVQAMKETFTRGLKDDRQPNDWMFCDDEGVQDRIEAIDRHSSKFFQTKDPKHLAAIACNAMIVWWHMVQK